MITRIKALLFGEGGASSEKAGSDADELTLATTALLVEAASLDGTFDDDERATILELLEHRFGLDRAEADELVAEATAKIEDSVEIYGFTRTIKDRYGPEDRVRMIEMLWEVAYADGVLHDFEANLVRRVAGLIYVPDRDAGEARKRVLERLGLQGP